MQALSDFQLREEVFGSASTRVCRAVRRIDGEGVVLKILGGEQIQSEAFAQYRHEYELTDSLRDIPGVIRIHGLENIQNSLMLVEEDIGGESLTRALSTDGIDLVAGLALAVRIADILGHIHQHRIIHKDINPSNIVWNRSTDELRIIDFGIASRLDQERQEFQSVNQLEGTLAYLSPEQTGRVNRGLDYRSDLYSLGVSLYQLFTGTLPFLAREGIELVHAHIALAPVPPHEVNPRVPEVLSHIILRLLAKMADDRYQSAWGLMQDLRNCLDQLRATGHIEPFPLGRDDLSTRFRLPQKLYGRAHETAAILAAFDRASTGGSELLLVSGSSGSGKSALVHEVHKPLTERHGSFVAGKFDQYRRDIPFYAWIQACEEFCKLLLKEEDASLMRWREKILAAIGSLGKALVDIVPSIETVLGPQPELPPLAGEQALNRLGHAFGLFLGAICRAEHPLVIFIDDWQWADAGSITLLKAILGNTGIRHLLVIGAYRDNEVHTAHPFFLGIHEIRKDASPVGEIRLKGLCEGDVHALVDDALHSPPGVERLARLAFEKTQGNAFFLVQLLGDLYEKSAITFSPERRQWVWRDEEIESRHVADNVVDLMAEKIRRLPDATRAALIHASCIGDRFGLDTLAALLGKPAHHAATDLEAALQEGILAPVGQGYRIARQEGHTGTVHYQFIHDRVRQAAYGLLASAAAEGIHHEIATRWLAGLRHEEQEQHIFDIANQYNAARRRVATTQEEKQLRGINLRAGKRARKAAAHQTALHYFRAALELLPAQGWQDDAQETAELHLLAAEAAFLGKDYGAMEQWLDTCLIHLATPLLRVQALDIRLQAYVAQNRLSEAVDVGLDALNLLGVKLPKFPGTLHVMGRLMQTRLALRGKRMADLLNLPRMTDPTRLAAMRILGLILPPAYWTSPNLLALTVFQMVRTSITHGHSPNAGYGFSWWGITECALLGDIDAGYEFGEFAIDLARKHGLNMQQPLFFVAWIVRKFKRPLRETIPLFEQTYALSLEIGDFEYASYARNNQMQALFHCGRNLDTLLQDMEVAHRDLMRFQIGSSLYWHDIWWQTARNFVETTAQPDRLTGPAYDEEVSLPQHLKVNDSSTLFLLYCAKLMLSCFFQERENALAHAARAREHLKAGVGMHAFALFRCYESLALLAGGGDDRAMRQVAANQKELEKWAAHAPANYRHHWLLVEAERLRVTGQPAQAIDAYDRAIDSARENGFAHEEALAHELAARCQLGCGHERLAGYYLRQSLQLYERWGAAAKSARLKTEFQDMLLTLVQSTETRHITTDGQATLHSSSGSRHAQFFDIAAVIHASQAISGEIVIDRLITALLKLVIAHGGARKAVLILKDGEILNIHAQGTAAQTVTIDLATLPIGEDDNLPLPRSLIQYVARTMKSQVIEDAQQNTDYARDPYVVRAQPRSILCEPILRQGKLVGMLYLENNLTTGAFTEERIELLRLLAAQAAISIENASLYHLLERKVEERTQKLQDSLAAQERLNADLLESGRQLEDANTQLREAQIQLQQQADTDALTGLANRRHFNERLRYELDRCARERQPLAILLCDIDNFKRYNDTYGHVAGDECLRRVSHTILATFSRSTDLVARYGGEEFVVLLPLTIAEQAAQLGEAMREAVEALGIAHSDNNGQGVVTLSAGCHALIPDADMPLEDPLNEADKALYKAKEGGRNRLVLAD